MSSADSDGECLVVGGEEREVSVTDEFGGIDLLDHGGEAVEAVVAQGLREVVRGGLGLVDGVVDRRTRRRSRVR